MNKKTLKAALAGLILSVSGFANAGLIAYINASGSDVSFLNSMGHTVTNFVNPIGLTYGALSGYDSVIVSSNGVFTEATNLGNTLRTFADNGGGVVLTEFAFQGTWALQGAILDVGYNPFTNDPLSSGYVNSVTVGNILQPNDSLFDNLNTNNILGTYNANVGLSAGATLVADWSNGRHAFAYNNLNSSAVVGLNMFQFYNLDERTLLSNAINISMAGVNINSVPEPSTLAIFALGIMGLVSSRFKK